MADGYKKLPGTFYYPKLGDLFSDLFSGSLAAECQLIDRSSLRIAHPIRPKKNC